jgi:hypothetical protein
VKSGEIGQVGWWAGKAVGLRIGPFACGVGRGGGRAGGASVVIGPRVDTAGTIGSKPATGRV